MDDAAARALIAARRADVLMRVSAMTADLESIVAGAAAANADDEHDPEGTTIAFERAQISSLLAEAERSLEELDQADLRLDAGTYGVCEICGGQIAAERLQVRPTSRSCVRCAKAANRPALG